MQIKFTRNCPPYNAGERASFNEAQGQRYIDAGSAVADDPPEAVALVSPQEVFPTEGIEATTHVGSVAIRRGRK